MPQRLYQFDSNTALKQSKPYEPFSPFSDYFPYALVLLSIGLVLTAAFIFRQIVDKTKSSAALELVLGVSASLTLGFGTLFGLLAAGLYV